MQIGVRIINNLSDDIGKRRPVQNYRLACVGYTLSSAFPVVSATTFSMQIVDKNFAVCHEGIVLESMLISFHYVSF
jgi:hypothetical protein